MHQFRTKEAVLKALLERQTAHFEEFSTRYMAKVSASSASPNLATQLATIREAATSPNSAALALVAANPRLMALPRERETERMAAIREEAADPDLAMIRWAGAMGLLLSSLFGLSPLSKDEHQRLFARLLDDAQWSGLEQPAATRTATPAAESPAKSGTASAAKAATRRKRA